MPGKKLALVPFELSCNNDFLKSNGKYDVVVLNYIYNASPEEMKERPIDPSVRVSPHHSPENWRRRLLNANPEKIIIFGCYVESEITGEYIGELPGYAQTIIVEKYGSIWIYNKL